VGRNGVGVEWTHKKIQLNGSANAAAILVLRDPKNPGMIVIFNGVVQLKINAIRQLQRVPQINPAFWATVPHSDSNKQEAYYWKCRNCLEKWKAFNRASERASILDLIFLPLCLTFAGRAVCCCYPALAQHFDIFQLAHTDTFPYEFPFPSHKRCTCAAALLSWECFRPRDIR